MEPLLAPIFPRNFLDSIVDIWGARGISYTKEGYGKYKKPEGGGYKIYYFDHLHTVFIKINTS